MGLGHHPTGPQLFDGPFSKPVDICTRITVERIGGPTKTYVTRHHHFKDGLLVMHLHEPYGPVVKRIIPVGVIWEVLVEEITV